MTTLQPGDLVKYTDRYDTDRDGLGVVVSLRNVLPDRREIIVSILRDDGTIHEMSHKWGTLEVINEAR